jgi:hypothetical protein
MTCILHNRLRIDTIPEPRRDAGPAEFVQSNLIASALAFHPSNTVWTPATLDTRPSRKPLHHLEKLAI